MRAAAAPRGAAEQLRLADGRRPRGRAAPPPASRRRPRTTRARLPSSASNAPAAARLSSTRLLTARGLMRRAKSERSANGSLAARLDDRLDRLAADALEGGERVVDGAALHLEGDAGAVDRGRLDLDAEPLGLGAKFRELVGIAHVERHGGRQELDRIVRLHVGGLIGDERVGGGVALVEAVIGEALRATRRSPRPGRVRCRARRSRRRSGCAASASRCGSSCPWRGAAGRPRRASSRRGSAPPASPVPGRR